MGLDVLYCTEYSVHRSSIYHDPSISLLKVQQRHVTWHVTDTALIWHRQMLLPSFPPSPLATPTLGGSDDFPLGTPVWIRMLFLSLLYRTDVVVGTFLTSWQGTRTLPHSRQGSRYLSIWHDTRRERHLVRMRHLTSLLSSLLLSLRLDITCFFFFFRTSRRPYGSNPNNNNNSNWCLCLCLCLLTLMLMYRTDVWPLDPAYHCIAMLTGWFYPSTSTSTST